MNSGIVSETPARQISTLYDVMWSAAGWSILLSLFGGLFFGGVVSLIRRFLKITPAQPQTPPEIPVFEE